MSEDAYTGQLEFDPDNPTEDEKDDNVPSDDELQKQWGDAKGDDDGEDVTEGDPVVDEDYEEDDHA